MSVEFDNDMLITVIEKASGSPLLRLKAENKLALTTWYSALSNACTSPSSIPGSASSMSPKQNSVSFSSAQGQPEVPPNAVERAPRPTTTVSSMLKRATMRPLASPPTAADAFIYEGLLSKKAVDIGKMRVFDKWKKRYMVLAKDALYYGDTREDALAKDNVKGYFAFTE